MEQKPLVCNQCGAAIDHSDVGLAFNMGFGPVYVCNRCKPPARASEIIADLNDFMSAASPPNDT